MRVWLLLPYDTCTALTHTTSTIASTLPRRSAPLSRGGARVRRADSGFSGGGVREGHGGAGEGCTPWQDQWRKEQLAWLLDLDKFGKDGSSVAFTSAYTAAPQCSPSRASLITGRTLKSHGLIENTDVLSKSMLSNSFPAALKKAGYNSAFFGKLALSSR